VDPDELIAHMLAAGALSDADLAMIGVRGFLIGLFSF
jgi:hypothetical protein